MTKHLAPADLPEDVALLAEKEVAAGHFASVEDVVRAGVYAVSHGDDLVSIEDDEAFIAAVREGQAQIARREGIAHAEATARFDARLAEHALRAK